MKQLAYFVLVYILYALQFVSAQQYSPYRITLEAFNDELRLPYQQLPLYCQSYPLPSDETVQYLWATSVYEMQVSTSSDTSPYAQYQPKFNNPRFGRVFCSVETQQRQLGRESIILEIQGYIEASGSTTVNLQPGEPLMLTTAVSQQYSSHSKSPLLNNVRVETEWRHNGIRVNSTAPIEELNLLIDNVQEANTGMYKLSVSHFYFTQYENGTDIPPLVGNQDRLCSRIILDVLGMYAIFSLVEFRVSIGNNELPPTPERTVDRYQFFEGEELLISFEVPLQQIGNVDYLQSPDNDFTFSFRLHINGIVIIDTTLRTSRRRRAIGPQITSQFQLINGNIAQVNITLPSPSASLEGLYEYQFYLSSRGVQELLLINECDETYGNFLTGGIGLSYFLIGEKTLFITMASPLFVNASKSYLTSEGTEGVTLTCALAQGGSVFELSWIKNDHQLATTNSSILFMNTTDVVGQQNTANVHGTYSCFAFERNGRRTTQNIHIPEKVSFSFQLRHRNGLNCASETTDDIKKASLSELMAIFSTVCYCDIISDYITMETVSCDDSVLTMSSDFTFSDEDGIMTASTLLSAAANVLIGERILDNITLLWDTSCPLRDVQGNCIEGSDESGLTLLDIGLMAALALALVVIILTTLIVCSLVCCKCCTRESKQTDNIQLPTPSHRPIIRSEPSNDPQSYSYPQIHSIAGGRALSLPIKANIRTNTHSSNSGNTSPEDGENGTESNQNFTSGPIMETSLNCTRNPAYSVTSNKNLSESTASHDYQSIRREVPNTEGPNGHHVYDYPNFQETSLESTSSDYYI